MTRQEIIDLIREKYDPVPGDWLAKDAHLWDDGTGEIADELMKHLGKLEAQTKMLAECHTVANEALRSAWQVAEREGARTNWPGHREQLRHSLDTSHAALDEIAAERRRQIEVEGWTPEHDDEHDRGEMAYAAACYALAARSMNAWLQAIIFRLWPWDRAWLKPGPARRMLIKAGALMVAEIERLDRAAAKPPSA